MIAYIYVRDLPLRLRGRELRFLRPDLPLLKIIVTKGLPMGLQMIVISSSALAMLGLVNQHGVQVTAAYGVTQQLWTYVQMPAMALGAAVSAMAAQNIGAGHWDRVAKITRTGVLFSLAMTGALIVILTLADRAVLGLFLGGDSAAMPIARHIQLIATWGFLFFGVGLVLFGTMRANGEVVGPLIIMFIAMYPVRLGFALGTGDWLGLDALWLSFPAGMVATSIMAVALYLQGGWKRRTMTPTMERPDEIECREQAEAGDAGDAAGEGGADMGRHIGRDIAVHGAAFGGDGAPLAHGKMLAELGEAALVGVVEATFAQAVGRDQGAVLGYGAIGRMGAPIERQDHRRARNEFRNIPQ